MTDFRSILTGTPQEFSGIFSVNEPGVKDMVNEDKPVWWGKHLRLKPEQLICAVGFNPHFRQLAETVALLGHTPATLTHSRNEIFSQDIYRKLHLDNVLTIYGVVKNCPETMQIMQYLLENRIAHIESKIESTVNSTIIEQYKAEVRAIYMEEIGRASCRERVYVLV